MAACPRHSTRGVQAKQGRRMLTASDTLSWLPFDSDVFACPFVCLFLRSFVCLFVCCDEREPSRDGAFAPVRSQSRRLSLGAALVVRPASHSFVMFARIVRAHRPSPAPNCNQFARRAPSATKRHSRPCVNRECSASSQNAREPPTTIIIIRFLIILIIYIIRPFIHSSIHWVAGSLVHPFLASFIHRHPFTRRAFLPAMSARPHTRTSRARSIVIVANPVQCN